jgi:ABC-type antimicrobial peptide transport system permease subunit
MTKMPKQFKLEKQIWSLVAIFGLLIGAYLVLVGTTVYNTLERQRAEKQISKITSELSEMEFSYLNLKAKINPELARSLGFVEVEDVIIAKKNSGPTAFIPKSKI